MVERGVSSMTLNRTITGLRFFFEVTLRRPDALELMSPVHEPRKLPVVLSAAEVEQMFDAPHLTETLEDGSELRYYGSSKFGYDYDFHWLSVAYRDGKATAVFSHDFCNQQKLKKRE